jgi:hypothetical protein
MIDVSKLRRKDELVMVLTQDRCNVEGHVRRAPKFLVHYPKTPGAEVLPQEAAFSRKEAEEIWSRVKRERSDLHAMDIRISTVSGEFV